MPTNKGLLSSLLESSNEEVAAQAARVIGELRVFANEDKLIELLRQPNERLRFHALEALGRLAPKAAQEPIIALVRSNAGSDTYIRHAAMIALARIGDADFLASLANDPDKEVRLTAIVALRRMKSPRLADFLNDEDEYVVAEAARAITDDKSVAEATPALAALLNKKAWTNEALLRRIIAAADVVGSDEAAAELLTYAGNTAAPEAMRAEALAALSYWGNPSVFHRVTGRYIGERPRSAEAVSDRIEAALPNLLKQGSEAVRVAAVQAAGVLSLTRAGGNLALLLQRDPAPSVRAATLVALDQLNYPELTAALNTSLKDRDGLVRQQALELLPKANISTDEAVALYRDVLRRSATGEMQAALNGIGQLKGGAADAYLSELLGDLQAGRLDPAVHLDLVEAVERNAAPALLAQLADYETELKQRDELGLLSTALVGGDPGKGMPTFYWGSAAQCTRCHAIFEYGGNVGPNLKGVADRLSRRELLTSIVRPSENIAVGHENVLLTLPDDELISGLVLARTDDYVELRTGKTDTRRVPRSEILEEETLPSSMPSAEGKLTRREIRDLVAFLGTVRGEHGGL